jgi:hypothetical protein
VIRTPVNREDWVISPDLMESVDLFHAFSRLHLMCLELPNLDLMHFELPNIDLIHLKLPNFH